MLPSSRPDLNGDPAESLDPADVDEVAWMLGHKDANVTRAVYVRELADGRRDKGGGRIRCREISTRPGFRSGALALPPS
jgi:hypothetical protein